MDFADGDGRRWRLPGQIDRRGTEALARRVQDLLAVRQAGDALPADLLRWLEAVPADFRQRLADAGLIDRDRVGGLRPLVELDARGKLVGGHLADMLADAAARGVAPMQCQTLGQRVGDVLSRAGAVWPRDLSAARVQAAVAGLAAPTAKHPDGLSQQSLKHYVRALKQFSKWLYRERRTAEDTLLAVKSYNPDTDKRHERRGFTAEEMAVLLPYTRQAPERWGMSGPARAAAYALAFASGLRRNEIRTLTRASFRLDADPPTVTVEAAYSKHRRQDVQPLPGDVAGLLADYLTGAAADKPFPLPDKSGAMLHEDMADARAAWLAQDGLSGPERQARQDDHDFLELRDSRALVLDFHSFRHGYVTMICKAEVSPRVMMELARHSDPRLTMQRYSRVAVADSAKALACLPRLAGPDADRQTLRATGTDTTRPAPDAPGRPRAGDHGQGRLPGRPVSQAVPEASDTTSDTTIDGDGQDLSAAENPAAALAISFAKSCHFGRTLVDSNGRKPILSEGEKPLDSHGKTAYSVLRLCIHDSAV